MSYVLETMPKIILPKEAENPVISELLSNYTYGGKWNVSFSSENCIILGDGVGVDCEDAEFALNATDDGVYIKGKDFSATMKGFVTFLEKIKYSDKNDNFYIENELLKEKAEIDFRCVHFCVFPETKLDFLRKCMRSCAVAKYSHIILEFWGMLKFDCMEELSWPFAYGKDQIKELVSEANALGVEIIPMFNHLGHASACREINGKHVVLDQNPKYEYMFDSYGWVWNFTRPDVEQLLGKIREELMEVCGKGSYFHLGCDEAYAFGHQTDKASEMATYLNKVSAELKAKGRRAIIWHDMLICREKFEGYVANSNNEISDMLIEALDKNIIIADWQYKVHNEVWKTSPFFKEKGFDVICCPWDYCGNIDEAVKTAKENCLTGIIHTTWHTLFRGFREMIYAGVVSYGTNKEEIGDVHRFYCASVARKVMPPEGDYEKCGWSEKMTGPGL